MRWATVTCVRYVRVRSVLRGRTRQARAVAANLTGPYFSDSCLIRFSNTFRTGFEIKVLRSSEAEVEVM